MSIWLTAYALTLYKALIIPCSIGYYIALTGSTCISEGCYSYSHPFDCSQSTSQYISFQLVLWSWITDSNRWPRGYKTLALPSVANPAYWCCWPNLDWWLHAYQACTLTNWVTAAYRSLYQNHVLAYTLGYFWNDQLSPCKLLQSFPSLILAIFMQNWNQPSSRVLSSPTWMGFPKTRRYIRDEHDILIKGTGRIPCPCPTSAEQRSWPPKLSLRYQ